MVFAQQKLLLMKVPLALSGRLQLDVLQLQRSMLILRQCGLPI